MRRVKSLDDLPNTIPSGKRSELPQGGRVAKQGSSSTIDKNPADHAGGLEPKMERTQSWETETIVADRRSSMGSQGSKRYYEPSKSVEIPPNGFVSERRPRRTISIRTIMRNWNDFKAFHPKAAKLVKWTAWLLGAAATTGGSVVLSEEIRKLYRRADLNVTAGQLEGKIDVITNEFESLMNDSMREFDRRPSPGIFDLYFKPVERVKRGDASDFVFDFEKIPVVTDDTNEETFTEQFFPKRNETYVGIFKHENDTQSGITHFNESVVTEILSTTSKPKFPKTPKFKELPLEMTSKFSIDTLPETVITYKIFEVSNVLIIVGALTIIALALILMCCFCYGCKSRERRYINRDTVRARVSPNEPNTLNTLSTAKYVYDTPTGAILNRSNTLENANYPHYEMVDIDMNDQQSTIGLTNRAFYDQSSQPAILSASQRPAVSTGQRRLISAF